MDQKDLVTTIAVLGIFLAGAAVGALLTVIVFSGQMRNLREIANALPGKTDQSHEDKVRGTTSDGRDAA